MSEWKPIDTAPKDGTKILIWNKIYEFAPIAWWAEADTCSDPIYGWHFDTQSSPCCSCEDNFIGWQEDIEDGLMPTHWLHLPPGYEA